MGKKSFIFIILTFASILPLSASPESEAGLKLGFGSKGSDQFDQNLSNYRSNSAINVFSKTELHPMRNFLFSEFFFKKKFKGLSRFCVLFLFACAHHFFVKLRSSGFLY